MTSLASFDKAMDPPPVFVGGTGRSGTTILGRVIGAHRSYALIPIELRFHTDRQGLIDILSSRISLEKFIKTMNGPFFHLMSKDGPRGLHLMTTRKAVNDALDEFADTFRHDRFTAARRLIQGIVQPVSNDPESSHGSK